jgi:cysteinyl-tRNA synthetase
MFLFYPLFVDSVTSGIGAEGRYPSKVMRLYNSLSRQIEEVKPQDGRTVRIYSCGPTVYRRIHLGNFRSFMLGDLIRRIARFEGLDGRLVMNITDVGHMTDDLTDTGRDKMELAESDEGLSSADIAQKYTDLFLADGDLLGVGRADVYPKATEHIPEMIRIIEGLIEKGHAYVVDGTVYYDVRSFPGYGQVSGNTLDALRAGHRQELEIDPNKRDAADFALWKAAGTARALKWPSPWGEGFPGWHIECSAMSIKHLGDRFEVHTGGNDNKFPHHEDERAQSDAYTGHPVVDVWVHGGFLKLSGQKIAKSRQNVVLVPEIVERGVDPLAFRLLCFGTQYRSEMDFSWESLEGANNRLGHLRQRMQEWSKADGSEASSPAGEDLDRRFRDALAEDLGLPHALVVLNEAAGSDVPDAEKLRLLRSWDQVLGFDLDRLVSWEPTREVQELVRERDEARKTGDYARSDAIRDQLTSMGLEVMDTPEGTKVRPRS